METNEIIKKLNMLRVIAPSRESMERIKRLVFAEPQERSFRVFWNSQPMWARGFAYTLAVAVIIMIPALSISRTPSLSSLKDADKLTAEAASLPISIELQEVSYQNDRNEIIGAAITEIKDTNVRHLKNDIIQSEIENIAPATNSEEEIDRLLEQVTS